MKTDNVIHIPERGCHNCRLHCVNHKQCDSEYPCKQGGEWRPIKPDEPSKGAKEWLKRALGNNMNISTLKLKFWIEAMEQYRAEGLKEELIKFMIWYNRHFDVADIQRESEKIINDYLSNNQKP
jgi:hypothetical protein